MTKNTHKIKMNICYENKQIINTYSTKFLRLFIEHSLSWNNHIDQLMSKLKMHVMLLCLSNISCLKKH